MPAFAGAATPSELWGTNGAKWSDTSRLPDFSFAGYHCGEQAIPEIPATSSVRTAGAAGDGKTDDTAAFRKAIESTQKGAILIPAGRYVITDTLKISKSGIILRGAGIGKTVLVIPKSLAQINGEATTDGTKSKWAFSGGFIEIQGGDKGKKLTEVTGTAKRGDRKLTVGNAAGITAGTWVRLLMNNSPSLGKHVHAGLLDASETTCREVKNFCDRAARVIAVNGNVITLDRPLRLDVRPEWAPEIWSWNPVVQETGIESLSFEFAGTPKKPHLKEEGFNAIHLRNAVNCWVRNVEVIDADNGVIAGGCRFCTISGFQARAAKRTKGDTGHHALWATGKSQDCLFTDFRVETTYVHDLTVEGCANGNVFERGTGIAIDLDHHSNAPYENLFTELNIGNARRLWNCGGRQDRGPHAAARTTLWNLRYSDGTKPPKVPDWPQINVIGLKDAEPETTADRKWVEPCGDGVTPANLYRAQFARRLGGSQK